jgi:hypothetical protein
MIHDCHIVLVVFSNKLPQGVRNEIVTAVKYKRFMLAFQREGSKMDASSKLFLKNQMYAATTVGTFTSLTDLFAKIRLSLLGLLVRRLTDPIEAKEFLEWALAT